MATASPTNTGLKITTKAQIRMEKKKKYELKASFVQGHRKLPMTFKDHQTLRSSIFYRQLSTGNATLSESTTPKAD